MCAALTLSACQLVTRTESGAAEGASATATAPASTPSGAAAAPIDGTVSAAPEGSPRNENTFAELVAYSNWVRGRTPEELRRLLPNMETRAKETPTPMDRLRLAILLSLPQAPFRDDARAKQLVDEVIRNHHGDASAFAYTLRWALQDRTALQGECDRALSQERRQRDALKQKLNELKAIEEQIHRREVNNPSRTP